MDISRLLNPAHDRFQPSQIHCPVNFSDCRAIRRLHADLKLHQPFSHACKQRKFLLRQKIRRYLKVKIRNSVVVLF